MRSSWASEKETHDEQDSSFDAGNIEATECRQICYRTHNRLQTYGKPIINTPPRRMSGILDSRNTKDVMSHDSASKASTNASGGCAPESGRVALLPSRDST